MSDIIIDANLIRNIAQGNQAAAAALTKMLDSGRKVYIARAAYNEVVGTQWALAEQYGKLLKELGIEIAPTPTGSTPDAKAAMKSRVNTYADNALQQAKPSKGIPGPMPEYGGKRDPVSGLKTRPADAFVAAEAKALNAELWTLDQQFARQARQQGVKVAAESNIASVGGPEDVATARKLLRPKTPPSGSGAPPTPPPGPAAPPSTPPSASGARARLTAAKVGLKAGLKAAFSAANIASAIPDALLAIADKVAAREAARKIQIKFIKEGFAKGVAAGVMRWSEDEVASNLMNRVTDFRVRGLGDAAGHLKHSYILKLAEAYENYAVYIGFNYTFQKTVEWNNNLRDKGLATLKERGYHFGQNPDALFEYDFIDKLAFVLRHETNPIIEPAIKFK
jgi:hypothetical protein